MNPAQFKTWAAELPTLTKEQLSELLSRVKLLSNSAVKEHDGKSDFGIRVLQAICEVMKRQQIETSLTTLRKSSAYANVGDKIKDLAIFFDTISKSKLVQDQILREAIGLLYFDLLNWKDVAISSHTIIQQIHRIPSVLSKHYPGYIASGLLTKIVKGA